MICGTLYSDIVYFLSFSSLPLMYELAAELIFPVPEGTSVGLLTLFSNVACLVFSFSSKFIPLGLMTWINALSIVLTVITFFLMQERYNRSSGAAGETSA